jgi:hypothetical protein
MLRVNGCNEYASKLFSLVLEMRPEEPQSHRDYALSLVSLIEKNISSKEDQSKIFSNEKARVQKALGHFARVVTGKWRYDFNEIEVTALQEMNAFLANCHSWHDSTNSDTTTTTTTPPPPTTTTTATTNDILDMTRDELPVEERLPADLLVNLPGRILSINIYLQYF